MVLWEDENMKVTNGIFSSLKILDKRNGRTLKPDNDTMLKFMTAWRNVRKLPFSSPLALRIAENELFFDLGRLTIDPDDPSVLHLRMVSADYLTGEYYRRGEYGAIPDIFRER